MDVSIFVETTFGDGETKRHSIGRLRRAPDEFGSENLEALLRNSCLRHDGPSPRRRQATRTISAVPSALKRLMRAMRIWI
ncbi:hypothetical protein, partial [Roseinatronobacter alkalisoli]|nr:hypothetical protein [Roseinatronobacter sp. HJB301]